MEWVRVRVNPKVVSRKKTVVGASGFNSDNCHRLFHIYLTGEAPAE